MNEPVRHNGILSLQRGLSGSFKEVRTHPNYCLIPLLSSTAGDAHILTSPFPTDPSEICFAERDKVTLPYVSFPWAGVRVKPGKRCTDTAGSQRNRRIRR